MNTQMQQAIQKAAKSYKEKLEREHWVLEKFETTGNFLDLIAAKFKQTRRHKATRWEMRFVFNSTFCRWDILSSKNLPVHEDEIPEQYKKKSNPNLELISNGRERADCTVRSLSFATGQPYEKVYKLLEKNGRRKNKGFLFGPFMRGKHSILGVPVREMKRISRKPITFRKFLQKHPEGCYIIRKRGHVAVVVDGKLYDTFDSFAPATRVNGAWNFLKKPKIQ